MQWSVTPEMSSLRRIAAVAGLLTVAACIWQLWPGIGNAVRTLGDTDDAMRIVLVRDLLHGHGWYDQLMTRIDPPHGVYFHWSRLIDGALAALMWLAGLFLPPATAELTVRVVWPLAWIFPAVFSALVVARNLGARTAVLIAAVLMFTEFQLYRQFSPGRVDHHDVQITLAMAALAIASMREIKPRLAAVAGIVSALGLAIGLEAMLFHAVIGASYAWRLARERGEARPVGIYGLSLAGATLVLYGIQTPPWRWGLVFCDTLAINLVLAAVLAGAGLAAVAFASQKLADGARIAAVAAAGIVAAATYLMIEPACIHGPFANLGLRLHQVWLDRVEELRPWPETLQTHRSLAIYGMTMMVMASAAAAFVWWRRRRMIPEGLALAMLAVACVCAFQYGRMEDYATWIGTPVLAAGFSVLAQRWLKDKMVPTVLAAQLLSPIFVGAALAGDITFKHATTDQPEKTAQRCLDTASFRHLALLPRGLVLADIDLGPGILANTPHDIVTAPYHRMARQILAAYDALHTPPEQAEAMVRRLDATYIVHCTKLPYKPASGLVAQLDAGRNVPWLTRLTEQGELHQIWRVEPIRNRR